jgi:hypothetical protein
MLHAAANGCTMSAGMKGAFLGALESLERAASQVDQAAMGKDKSFGANDAGRG